MSSTRVFTPIKSASEDTISTKIVDHAAFESHMKGVSDADITALTYTTQSKVSDEYPKKYEEHKYLQGFTAYPNQTDRVDVGSILKLENFGFGYNHEVFVAFWEEVASYCEPFSFIHASANAFPSTTDIAQGGYVEPVYRVECDDEGVQVTELELGFEETTVHPQTD